jgi:HNH endonuclease
MYHLIIERDYEFAYSKHAGVVIV